MWCSATVMQWEAEEVGFSPQWVLFFLLLASYYFSLLQKAFYTGCSHPVGVPSPVSPPLHLLVSHPAPPLVHPPRSSAQPSLNTFPQRHHLVLWWVKCCHSVWSTVEPAGNVCDQHRAASDISHTAHPHRPLPLSKPANVVMFHQWRT